MKWFLGVFTVLMFLAGSTGCALGPEANSGTDQDRLGAIEVKINDLVRDHVSCIDGDKTDWKYFTVPAETPVSVTFAFDEPSAGGTIVIRQATGVETHRLQFKPGSRMVQTFHAVPGHYFLEIFCEAFQSEYTIEVSLPH